MPGIHRIPKFYAGAHHGGALSVPQRKRLAAHIESCSIPEPNSGCWLWLGALNEPEGRARLVCYGDRYAARLAYRAFIGECTGTKVLHKCDNPGCVNPDHLHTGSQRENMRECMMRGRFVFNYAQRGTAHHGAKLTDDIVLTIKRRLADGERHAALAAEFGVSRQAVGDIASGRNWGWL